MREYHRTTKRRIYPLRTSSSQWKIPLYSKHKCSDTCKLTYVTEQYYDTTLMIIVDNPQYKDGKCDFYDTFNPTIVKINDFSINCPHAMDGELLYDNQIVIPDTEILINVEFPVTHTKKVRVHSSDPLGFSLSRLLQTIKYVYNWVYSHEERTATARKFTIENQCICIRGVENKQNIYEKDEKDEKECSICLDTQQDDKVVGKCNHFFHKKCIDQWIDSGKDTCPLCRSRLYMCKICNNTKIVQTYYEGKVLPKELRGTSGRHQTDGAFGIYGYDIDQLFIEDMIYNSITKTVSLRLYGS